MGLMLWLCIGCVVGFFTSYMVNYCKEGFWGYIFLGMTGAVLGGSTAHMLGWIGIASVNYVNALAALGTCIVGLVAYQVGWHYHAMHPDNTYAIETRFRDI